MQDLGEAARQLIASIKIIPKEPRTYSSDDSECKDCKDSGRLLFKRNKATGEEFPFDQYVRMFNGGMITNLGEWVDTSAECACQIKAREIRRMDRILGSSRLSPKFLKRTFDRIVWLDPQDFKDPKDRDAVARLMADQREAFDMMRDYAMNWRDYAIDGKGVGLYGDPGVAKTHLLAAKTLQLLDQGIRSVFINTSEVFDEIRKAFSTDDSGAIRQVKPSEIIDIIKGADDLSLDDIGTERPTPFVLECFYNIINHRYEWELPTSFSTNLTDEELKAHMTPKTHRRLIEPAAGRCCMIKGPSFDRLLNKLPRETRSKYQA